MKQNHRIAGLALAIVVSLAIPPRVWPQAARGSIAGFVKDASGAVIPGARVTATEEQTGEAIVVESQPDGAFLIPQLSPASYQLSGERQGFKRLSIDHLTVNVATTTTQDLVLAIGTISESVEVVGRTSQVETTNGEVGTTVQVDHVVEMPLVDRNVFNLVTLVPGVVGTGSNPSIGGGRMQYGSLDGGRSDQLAQRTGPAGHRVVASGGLHAGVQSAGE